MGRWSEWYLLTEDAVDEFGIEESGVYQIALGNRWVIKYPLGESPIIYIGAAPARTLKERLKEHIRGKGNQCVYEFLRKYTIFWRDMVVDDPVSTEQNALESFRQAFGDLPICNKRSG
ncbi:MAG: hypothetical protein ABIK84_04205 [candidate division WOR-3 bacterium]